jgi:GNAT superfamily N-acetyltransferase
LAAVVIRKARFDDESEVLPLLEELFVAPGSKPRDYSRERATEAFRLAVSNDRMDVLIAFVEGKPAGLASVYVDILSMRYGRRCFVEDLIVLPDRRGTGVGAQLLEAACDWGRRFGCDHLQLNSGNARKDAHRFYKANGMEQDSLVFSKRL